MENRQMAVFKLEVERITSYTDLGEIEIEADSLEEARKIAFAKADLDEIKWAGDSEPSILYYAYND